MLRCFIQFLARPAQQLNTQAHLLIAAALLCRSSNLRGSSRSYNTSEASPNGPPATSRNNLPAIPVFSRYAARPVWPVNTAVLIGALVPDISLFLMFAFARIRGIDDDVIWGELYYSAFWQNIGAMTNSVPIYLALTLIGLALFTQMRFVATVIFVFGFAALLHCLTDLPLHVDDGRAHFWPFSAWIYESPVSYWDSNHYANYWQPVEFLIASVAALTLWRQFQLVGVRIAVVIGLLTYPVMLFFWFFVMH